MKSILLVVVLFLPGCTFLKDSGQALCDAQTETAEIVTEAGAWVGLGGAGPVVADVLNMTLQFFCTIVDTGLKAPAAVGDLVGVPRPEGATDVVPEDGS